MAGNNKTIVIAIVALLVVVAFIVGLIVLLPSGDKDNKNSAPTSSSKETSKIEKIEIESVSKINYYIGEELDLAGIKINAKYSNGTVEKIDATNPDVQIVGFDSSFVNENGLTVYVTYKEKTTSFEVTVLPIPEEIQGTVIGIGVDSISKSVYDLNEELDLKGIKLAVTVAERAEPYIVDADYPEMVVTGFDSSAVNDALKVTITYKDCSASFNLIIRDKANYEVVILGLNFVTMPRTTYKVGEAFDYTDMKIQIETQDYTSDFFIDANDPRISFSNFDSSEPNDNLIVVVTFTYTYYDEDEKVEKERSVSKNLPVVIESDNKPVLQSVNIIGLKTEYTKAQWNKNGLHIHSGVQWEYKYDNSAESVFAPVKNNHLPQIENVDGPCQFDVIFTDDNGNTVTVTITITE